MAFDLFPGQPVYPGYSYLTPDQDFTTNAAGTAVVPLMPMTSPLTLSVAPPPGSGLGGTAVNAGTMAASTAVTATLAGSPHQQTGTALSSAPNPSGYGQAVTFTATVSPTDGQGTVSFASTTGKQMTALCPGQSLRRIGDSYQASCTTSSLPVGIHTITAAYSGDTDYGGSSSTLSQTVEKAPTATVISSSKNPSAYGQRVAFTAIVSPADSAGTVTFWQAGHTIPDARVSHSKTTPVPTRPPAPLPHCPTAPTRSRRSIAATKTTPDPPAR
jgi:large repetitive protein